jgi:prepilin-type N-terminal cleavage/methylation domain-containing protein
MFKIERKGIFCKRGFTLVEILLVIAIIGILAGTLYVGLGGQRKKARTSSALESIRSALPYAAECYLKNNQPIRRSAGGEVCGTANGFTWPALPTACAYLTDANITGDTQIAYCDDDAAGTQIFCNVEDDARCWIQ